LFISDNTGDIEKKVRNKASKTMTALGGDDCSPNADLSIDKTIIILVNDVDAMTAAGINERLVTITKYLIGERHSSLSRVNALPVKASTAILDVSAAIIIFEKDSKAILMLNSVTLLMLAFIYPL